MSVLSPRKLDIQFPLFYSYIIGNDGCDLLSALENEHAVKFILGDNALYVDSVDDQKEQTIKEALITAWKMDDFRHALELSELVDKSDYQFVFEVSRAEAALLQINSKSFLRRTGLVQLKTDSEGRVCIFGKGVSVSDHYETLISLLRKAVLSSNIASECNSDGPCILLMSVPNSVVHYVLTSNRRSLNTLERTIRCLVDVNYRKVDTAGNVQIEIIAKDLYKVLAAKAALLDLIESHVGKVYRWPSPITVYCGSRVSRNIPEMFSRTVDDCENALYGATIKNLIFNVAVPDAPRLIGIHGVNKRRIEERTKCFILLHTEAKSGGEFPVEIIGRSAKECEAARHHIQNFLKAGPRQIKASINSPIISQLSEQFSAVKLPRNLRTSSFNRISGRSSRATPSNSAESPARARPKVLLRRATARRIFSDSEI